MHQTTSQSPTEPVIGKSTQNFYRLMDRIRKQRNSTRELPERLLSLDPGLTVGWSLWINGHLSKIGECAGTPQRLDDLLRSLRPTLVVAESYRIYSWMLKEHRFSDVPTLRLIGAIELICVQLNVRLVTQTAQQGKSFATNTKLHQWGFYRAGLRHSMDAVRHAVYYLLFSS
jgi:hypothetical protein